MSFNKQQYIKNTFQKDTLNVDLGEIITLNNCRIDEIGILFNFPGYNTSELKEQGICTLLTIDNIEEYIALIYNKILGAEMSEIISSFKSGFNSVFDINNLKSLKSSEIERTLLSNDDSIWDYDVLYEHIIPDHGYNKDSLVYNYLIELLINFNENERKMFLQFSTGCTRLPIGGKY